MIVICIKQHLSNIWISIHEKDKQHWGWNKKSVVYNKNACTSEVLNFRFSLLKNDTWKYVQTNSQWN